MSQMLGRPATWFVRPEDAEAYMHEGATVVPLEYPRGQITVPRNAVLAAAWAEGVPAVMLDDDLKRMRVLENRKPREVHAWDGITELVDRLFASDLFLAGCPPTDNAYFAHKETSTNLFVIASLMVVRPCELTFRPGFAPKEDYDYTLQHIARYGGAYRWNHLLPTFNHYSNPGGFTGIRTAEMEEEACRQLILAWPGMVRRNKKREHEVLLTIKSQRRVMA